MEEITERIENNFINIYNKFDILDKKLNNYHTKFHKINEMIDIIISDEYTKIYKTYYPMKNYDLVQDRFFIYSEIIDIPLKKNTFIIFPGPPAFCKKALERVNSEKNILNS